MCGIGNCQHVQALDQTDKLQCSVAIVTTEKPAELLETDRTNISKLRRSNELRKFTFDRLLSWLTKLDRDVTLTVKRKSGRRESGKLRVAVAQRRIGLN